MRVEILETAKSDLRDGRGRARKSLRNIVAWPIPKRAAHTQSSAIQAKKSPRTMARGGMNASSCPRSIAITSRLSLTEIQTAISE